MKKSVQLLILLLTLLYFNQTLIAQDTTKFKPRSTDEAVIKNLLEGLDSDNLGLLVSCAYYLGERKASEAVIPLMGLLKSDKQDEARIMAALSLFKIGDSRGIYAIQQRAKFEDSEQVKRMCEIFYGMYQKQ